MPVEDIAVVSVPVSDQERAKDFYVNRMGMELKQDDSSIPGLRWIMVAPNGGRTALTLVTWFDSMPPGSLQGLVLRSRDLESDYKTLASRGVEFESPPTKQPWGTEAVIRDPDGNRLVLQQL